MSSHKLILLSFALIGALLLQPTTPLRMTQIPSAPVSASTVASRAPAIQADYGQMPLYFVENQGQMDERVAYYIQGSDKTLYFTPDGVTFALTAPGTLTDTARAERPVAKPVQRDDRRGLEVPESTALQRWTVKLDFVGANPKVRPVAEEQAEAVFSYFTGRPDEWHAGLRSYRKLVYPELWPGIDLVYYGTVNQVKYEFIVKPGADPDQIRLAYRGATDVRLNADGQMVVSTPFGGFRDDTPVAFQDLEGQRVSVPMAYALAPKDSPRPHKTQVVNEDTRTFGFTVGDYDHNRALLLDPAVLVYAGYIGGAGIDEGRGIAVDSAGNAYVVGATASSPPEFPVEGGPDLVQNGGTDAFVVKINREGTDIVYAGYIGGTEDDEGNDIAVDSFGNAYITGLAYSDEASFPVRQGPDTTHNGQTDVFVAELNAVGTELLYCGYIGSTHDEHGTAIVVDTSGHAYVAGRAARDFPVRIGPELTHDGGEEGFIAKIESTGESVVYLGYIGGNGADFIMDVAVDSQGAAYVTGWTNSDNVSFPISGDLDQSFNGGSYDAFVVKVNPSGSGFAYGGYIGGESQDTGTGIAVDTSGRATVVGSTASYSDTFPAIGGPSLQLRQSEDAFIARVNSTGSALDFAGYIGGTAIDYANGVALDSLGNAYLIGNARSSQSSFPVTNGPDLTFNGIQDVFIAKVSPSGSSIVYATYLGGSAIDSGNGIAVDSLGNVYATGSTQSGQATFPTTGFPDQTFGGLTDAFAAKVSGGIATYAISGRIASNNQPLTGVTVSAGAGGSATTDANGNYVIANVPAGTYTLTPTKSGITFSPVRVPGVTVPPSRTAIDFVASSWGAQPTPFLDLPVPYDGSKEFSQILQNWSVDGGRINSWFDHKYPDYGSNNGTGLWLFTSPLADAATAYWSGNLRCFDLHCYDGHDGIDIVGSDGVEVLAAYSGTVALANTTCPQDIEKENCGDGFGKYVVIYHSMPATNGYFTLYGHLSAVAVAEGGTVTTGQIIGAMGNTGRSAGPHLHLGVYRDDGDGNWEGGGTDKPVDPFGYRAAQPDPWVAERSGPPSYRLWVHDPTTSASTSGQAITLVGATQNITATVGANRFPGQATVELMPGPVAGPSAQLRLAGQSFWLTLVEWIQGSGSTPGAHPADTPAAAEPITVTVQYSEAQARHLDMSLAAIYRWDEVSGAWQALPTTLNGETRTLTGLSPDVGQFSPQAPLLCPADTSEPDDDLYRATSLSFGSASAGHVFDSAADEDWFAWEAQANVPYVIRTQGLTVGVDTVLEIRDVNGLVVATDDNSGGGAASRIERTFAEAGIYFARIVPKAGSATGCASAYQVSVFIPRVFLPGLSR